MAQRPSLLEELHAAVDVVLQRLGPPQDDSTEIVPDELDLNPALRGELHAALDVLGPQLRGLEDLAALVVIRSISGPLGLVIQAVIEARQRRRARIQAVLDALDTVVAARRALKADGYPQLLDAVIGGPLFAELEGEFTDFLSAISVFKPEQPVSVDLDLSAATDRPQPIPPA